MCKQIISFKKTVKKADIVTSKYKKPSKMEVAPPHRTVDITQKRVLSKTTKEAEKM